MGEQDVGVGLDHGHVELSVVTYAPPSAVCPPTPRRAGAPVTGGRRPCVCAHALHGGSRVGRGSSRRAAAVRGRSHIPFVPRWIVTRSGGCGCNQPATRARWDEFKQGLSDLGCVSSGYPGHRNETKQVDATAPPTSVVSVPGYPVEHLNRINLALSMKRQPSCQAIRPCGGFGARALSYRCGQTALEDGGDLIKAPAGVTLVAGPGSGHLRGCRNQKQTKHRSALPGQI